MDDRADRPAAASRRGDDPRRGPTGPVLAVLYGMAALLPVLAAASSGIEPARWSGELASALGLTAAALLLLQFLSSGRYESISGRIGLDRTFAFHRLAAFALLAFALLHPLLYVAGTALADPVAAGQRLSAMLSSPRLRTGVVALAALIAIVGLAAIGSRLRYEIWRASHSVLAIAGASLALHHAVSAGTYSAGWPLRALWLLLGGTAAAAILHVYVIRPWRMWRERWHVESVRRLADRTIEMALLGPSETPFRFRAGQFIWVALWPSRPPFHDHPFSIASSPAELPRLRLVIREAGNCTNRFMATPPGTRVAVDGPHGSFVLPDGPGPVVMITGGVGIAPVIGIIEEAAARGDRRAFRLLYAARRAGELACLDRLEALRLRLNLSMTCLVDEGPRGLHAAGPLQEAHVEALLSGLAPAETTALVCGPGSMMAIATDMLLDAGVPRAAIHYERFDFGSGRSRLDRLRLRESLVVFAALAAAMAAFALR